MTPHNLLPLFAFFLNVSLATVSLLRNPASRLNRVFAYFAGGMALWNFGVFGLRRAPDASSAFLWEVVLHVGVVLIPLFYYHFVLIFLEATTLHRRLLMLAYVVAIAFGILDLAHSSLFMKGVQMTYWGWAPKAGRLYILLIVYLEAYMIGGLVYLTKEYRREASSFRRNRAMLILLGTAVSVAGGLIDFLRFVVANVWPEAEHVYPMGIPLNMIFAVMLGTSIVRYRLFDVNVFVKRAAVYLSLATVLTGFIGLVTWAIEQYYELTQLSAVWAIIPVSFVMTLFLSPSGHVLEDLIQRVMFSKRRGCYQTLLDLSKRMIAILDFNRLVDTLVQGLVRGVPLTHASLLLWDEQANAYVPYREETSFDDVPHAATIPVSSPVAQWLFEQGQILVKEEVKVDPRIAQFFETTEAALEEIPGSLIVPIKVENKLIAILLLGEKLSGEIFDSEELEVLGVLANQAAISLENARLYDGLSTSNARLVEASRLKSQFLASMSHELRTPLNSIIGFSKVLLKRLDGELNERQDAYIRSVHNSSTHLLQLINSILDFSRSEAGKLEMHVEEVDVLEVVEECIETSVPLVREKRLKLEKDIPLELPPIQGDRIKLKQVLLNLISNSIKFTADGRILVVVRLETSAVHVSVADTGIGIRDSDLDRLFEPFHRVDSPLTRAAGGTGLGLTISKRFVELHGGRIWAESRENHGSTFHFTLPLAAVPAGKSD